MNQIFVVLKAAVLQKYDLTLLYVRSGMEDVDVVQVLDLRVDVVGSWCKNKLTFLSVPQEKSNLVPVVFTCVSG